MPAKTDVKFPAFMSPEEIDEVYTYITLLLVHKP
jgi:hypothetical protein